MKKLLIIITALILTGCAAKYAHISPDGSKLSMENYVVTESVTYSPDGKVLKSKKVMIPMYEGMLGKINTLVKPVLDLLLEY